MLSNDRIDVDALMATGPAIVSVDGKGFLQPNTAEVINQETRVDSDTDALRALADQYSPLEDKNAISSTDYFQAMELASGI